MLGTQVLGGPSPQDYEEARKDEEDRIDLLVEHVQLPADESPYDRIRRTFSREDFWRKTNKLIKERAEKKQKTAKPDYDMAVLNKKKWLNTPEAAFYSNLSEPTLDRIAKKTGVGKGGRWEREKFDQVLRERLWTKQKHQ